ncbi:MAG: hypothetical protein Q8Q09_23860 [Deltaproteobacteria bacterium]|nr:hypothetical protein [Deltaproteobacteria bacterium]
MYRRQQETRGGTFGKVRSTPVHSRDWWFCRVEDVKLHGGPPHWQDLDQYRVLIEERVKKKASTSFNADWVREHLPIALGLNPDFAKNLVSIDLELLAVRIEAEIELMVPVLFREHDSKVLVGFSPDGPARETQREIMVELGARVLWAAVGGFK